MPEPDQDALRPFLEMTIRNLTKSALASSHIECDYWQHVDECPNEPVAADPDAPVVESNIAP